MYEVLFYMNGMNGINILYGIEQIIENLTNKPNLLLSTKTVVIFKYHNFKWGYQTEYW